jgi:hypothetical protein
MDNTAGNISGEKAVSGADDISILTNRRKAIP